MIPACTLDSILNHLRKNDNTPDKSNQPKANKTRVYFQICAVDSCTDLSTRHIENEKIIGILFARPTNDVAKKEILGDIDYFHARSGDTIDFYLPGYGAHWSEQYAPDKETVISVGGVAWYFSNSLYVNFEKELQKKIKWLSNGDCELLLLSVQNNKPETSDGITFSSAISINVTMLLKENLIPSVASLFSKIFNALESTPSLSIRELSDKLALNNGQHILLDLLGIFPGGQALAKIFSRLQPYALKEL